MKYNRTYEYQLVPLFLSFLLATFHMVIRSFSPFSNGCTYRIIIIFPSISCIQLKWDWRNSNRQLQGLVVLQQIEFLQVLPFSFINITFTIINRWLVLFIATLLRPSGLALKKLKYLISNCFWIIHYESKLSCLLLFTLRYWMSSKVLTF